MRLLVKQAVKGCAILTLREMQRGSWFYSWPTIINLNMEKIVRKKKERRDDR